MVREFEDFTDTAGGPASEARVWWLDAEPILIGPHPDNPAVHVEPDLTAIAPTVSRFGRRFITTDVARRVDGVWRVIEVGDAQVSDLPSTVDPAVLIGPLVNRRHDLPVFNSRPARLTPSKFTCGGATG